MLNRHVGRFAAAVACLVLAAGGSGPALEAQQMARLFIGVVGTDGTPLTDLSTGDFEITWGDTPSDILNARLASEPMKLTLLVDNSGAIDNSTIEHIRDGLRAFVGVVPEGHDVALIAIARQPRWVVRHTDDREDILRGIDRIVPDGDTGMTLLDGLVEAGDRVGDDEDRREVIVSISTNMGESSNNNHADHERLVRQVAGLRATVHMLLLKMQVGPNGPLQPATLDDHVGPRSQSLNRLGPTEDSNLPTNIALHLPEVTGGRYVALAASSGLPVQLERLAHEIVQRQAELARQYRIIVTRPETLDASQTLQVRVDRPDVRIYVSPDGRAP